MTPEERKIYNKKYYGDKKDKILSKLSEKIECEVCKRQVRRQNLPKHKLTFVCKRIAENNNNDKISQLENQIKELLKTK